MFKESMLKEPISKTRRASSEVRREQLILATIETVAANGLSALKLSDISTRAGLSGGIINFHFTSKESLLLETLRYLADEYQENWKKSLLDTQNLCAAERLKHLLFSDFNHKMVNPNKLSAWGAFLAEANSHAAYQTLCWNDDLAYKAYLGELCETLKQEKGYSYDTQKTALLICIVIDGLWYRIMTSDAGMNRDSLSGVIMTMLSSIFPKHFNDKEVLG